MKRILVSGSRDWDDVDVIHHMLGMFKDNSYDITLVHGDCPTGADRIANDFAKASGWKIETHPADWNAFGKYAGPKRNQDMVDAGADVVLAFIKNESRGASGTAKMAAEAGLEIITVRSD